MEIPKAYASAPPVIRDRYPTLELEDDDVIDAAPVRRSTPPPPPPARKAELPKIVALPLPKIVAAQPLAPIEPLEILEPIPESRVQRRDERPTEPPAPPTVESLVDPTDLLFDVVYELNFVDTAWQAASVCAGALAAALRARAVVIHAHDLERRELRAIGVHGALDLLGSSEGAEDDLVASAVMCNEKPVTMKFDGELPRLAPRRLSVVGAPRTLVAVPAMAWGRCVAMIEIIDADDRYAARVADSASYVAERLAEFLSERAAA
ncbi:MAG: hypothetical protein KF819_28250 [Labilithrix sp.]|nr:hypothetical protein [Labilithrix sp.]